jgi:hypothetical protein
MAEAINDTLFEKDAVGTGKICQSSLIRGLAVGSFIRYGFGNGGGIIKE